MIDPERRQLVAPCGIDCGVCEVYLCKDNQRLFDHLVSLGFPADKLPCTGCRPLQGRCPVIGSTCQTYACAAQKGVEHCSDCADFPCPCLHPAAERADKLPHNLKLYNLCFIKARGIDAFVAQSAESKKRYFKGKLRIGAGPSSAD